MPSNPIDSVIVKIELDTTGIKTQLVEVDKIISSHFNAKKFKIQVELNENSLSAIQAQIKKSFSVGKIQAALDENSLKSIRATLKKALKLDQISVALNPNSVASLRSEIQKALDGLAVTVQVKQAAQKGEASKTTGDSVAETVKDLSVLEAKAREASKTADAAVQSAKARILGVTKSTSAQIAEATGIAMEATGKTAATLADKVQKFNSGALTAARLDAAKLTAASEQAVTDMAFAQTFSSAKIKEASAAATGAAEKSAARIKEIKAQAKLDIAKETDETRKSQIAITAAEKIGVQERIALRAKERLHAVESAAKIWQAYAGGQAHTNKTAQAAQVLKAPTLPSQTPTTVTPVTQAAQAGLQGVAQSANAATRAVTRTNAAVRQTAANAQNMAQGFYLARSNAELMASSIFTVRNVIAALSTLGVFRVFRDIRDASADFETSLVAVAKTANLSDTEMEDLGKRIQEIGRELPITTKELLNISIAAGQLGIEGTQEIAKFTKALGQLALTTDVQGEEGARQVARILNLTKTPTIEVDRFAASLVELGNRAAATEKEILEVATKVSQAVAVFGFTADEVLAISTTLRELGVEAELGGTQMGLFMQALTVGAMSPGSQAERSIKKLGLEINDFRETLRGDPAEAFTQFVEKLGGLDASQVTKALEQLGFEGARMGRVFGPLSQNALLLRIRLTQSAQAWEENVAAIREVERQSDTFSGRMTVVGNKLGQIVKLLGDDMNPIVADLAENFTRLATADLGKTVEAVKALGAALAVLTIAKAPAFGTDILIGLKRLQMLRNDQRTAILAASSANKDLLSGLVKYGTKFADFVGKYTVRLGLLAGITFAVSGAIGRHFQKMAKAPEALSSWEVVKTLIGDLRAKAESDLPEITNLFDKAREAIEKEFDVDKIKNVPERSVREVLHGVSQDLTAGESWERDKNEAKRFFRWLVDQGQIAGTEAISAFKEFGGRITQLADLEQIAAVETHFAFRRKYLALTGASTEDIVALELEYAEAIEKANKKLEDTKSIIAYIDKQQASRSAARKRGEFDAWLGRGADKATRDKKAQAELFEPDIFNSENITKIKKTLEPLQEVFASFFQDAAKVETATEEMDIAFENSTNAIGRYKNEFSDFLSEKGFGSFAIFARNQAGTMEFFKEKAAEMRVEVERLNTLISRAPKGTDVSGLLGDIEESERLLSLFNQLARDGTEVTKLFDKMEKSFRNLKTMEMNKEARESLTDFNIAMREADKVISDVDVPTLQKWAKELGGLVLLFPGLGAAMMALARSKKKMDVELSNTEAFTRLRIDADRAVREMEVIEKYGSRLGSSFTQFMDQFSDEEIAFMSPEKYQELLDLFNVMSGTGAQRTLFESMENLDVSIASVTHSSKDMMRVLRMSEDEYVALDAAIGGIDERTADWLISLDLTGAELLVIQDRLGGVKEKLKELEDAERVKEVAEMIGEAFGSFGDELTGALLDGELSMDSFLESFRNFANQIVQQIIKIMIWDRMAEGLTNLISGGLGQGGRQRSPKNEVASEKPNAFGLAGGASSALSALGIPGIGGGDGASSIMSPTTTVNTQQVILNSGMMPGGGGLSGGGGGASSAFGMLGSILGAFAGGGGGFMPSTMGAPTGVMAKGGVFAYAKGGMPMLNRIPRNNVVAKAAMAPMALFGEAGPEAIMPLVKGGRGGFGVRDVRTKSPLPLTRDKSGMLSVDTGPLIQRLISSQRGLGQREASILFRALSSKTGTMQQRLWRPGQRLNPLNDMRNQGLFGPNAIGGKLGQGFEYETYTDPKTGELKRRPKLNRFIRRLSKVGSEYDQQKFLDRIQEAVNSGDQQRINEMLAMQSGMAFSGLSTIATPSATSFAMGGVPNMSSGISAYASGGIPSMASAGPSLVPSVTQNYNSGGEVHLHIDARGSSDPAAMEAAANRVLQRNAGKLIEASVQASKGDRRRNPNSWRS